jgi:hypothetical protein
MTKGHTMSRNTQYLVLLDGETVETKSKKDRAIQAAEALRAENSGAEIVVTTGAGNTVHVVKLKGTHAKPWTRTETHEGIEVEVPAGYTVAYTRKRVGAVVARADDKSGYLVITDTGVQTPVTNTKEAREVTNQLAADHRVEVAAKKEQDKAAKAEAKAKRDADRAEARAAKEAAKEAKRQEREAAKAEKETADASA